MMICLSHSYLDFINHGIQEQLVMLGTNFKVELLMYNINLMKSKPCTTHGTDNCQICIIDKFCGFDFFLKFRL